MSCSVGKAFGPLKVKFNGFGWRVKKPCITGNRPNYQRNDSEMNLPKDRMITLASPILMAAFPQPSASLNVPPAAPSRGYFERNLASARSRVMIIGDEYWASMRVASRPGSVEVSLVSRARSAFGEDRGLRVGLGWGLETDILLMCGEV